MWLWRAFQRLSTTRPRGFSQGPISYRETMKYGDELAMTEDDKELLWDMIHAVDTGFLKLLNDKMKAESKRK